MKNPQGKNDNVTDIYKTIAFFSFPEIYDVYSLKGFLLSDRRFG